SRRRGRSAGSGSAPRATAPELVYGLNVGDAHVQRVAGELHLQRGDQCDSGLVVSRRPADIGHWPSAAAESFDTVVVTLALCAVPDDRQAIREMARVLRPNGRLVWLEHVRSPYAPVRWVQRLLDPVLVRLE